MSESDAARVFRLTLRLSTETLGGAASEIEALGMEVKAFFVLDGVEERPYPAELSRHLSIPRPTMTLYLKNLQAQGFIVRAIDPQDLRRHRLELTPLGRDVLARARDHLFGRYRDLLLRLSPGEQAEFARLLEKLVG